MIKLIISLMMITSPQAFALDEASSLETMKNLVTNNEWVCPSTGQVVPFFQTKKFRSRHGQVKGQAFYTRYTKIGCAKGKKGSIVLAPGRTESSLKYLEAALDFIKQGYSPVYAIDHRGQGFSPRILENTNKGYVEEFSHFVDDFEDFVKIVQKDNQTDNDKLFLMAHSMGGGISTVYLQRMGSASPFKAAVYTGPMIKIDLGGNPPYFEWAARLATYKVCNGMDGLMDLTCNGYVQKQWQDYNPQNSDYNPSQPKPGDMTHSANRYAYRQFLWDTMWPQGATLPAMYETTENWDGLALGGPTTRWMWQATKTNMQMRKKKEVRKMKTPLVIITGDQDVRAKISAHSKFCKKVNRHGAGCTFYNFKGAYHEVLAEKDYYRQKALNIASEFFEKNSN